MSGDPPVRDNFRLCGGTMRTNVLANFLLLFSCAIVLGCGETECPKEQSRESQGRAVQSSTNIYPVKVEPYASTNTVGAADMDHRLAVERLLADDLSSTPIRRRYRAQRDRQRELWEHLVLIRTNDAVYVISAVARLQAQWEHDLATIRIPERKVPREPVLRTPDGLYYSVYTNRAKIKQVRAETTAIDLTKAYLKQLRFAIEDDTLGIDSQYLWFMYRSLDTNARRKVMARVISILGRSPRWEKWQQ